MKRPAAAVVPSRAVLKRPASACARITQRKRPAAATAVLKRPASHSAARKPAGFRAWEGRLAAEGFHIVAGTDEAGRGPLAGPVVAAALAVLDHGDAEVQRLLSHVQDSKKMTAAQREEVFAEMTAEKFNGRIAWAIAEASVAEIDEMNILRASLLAMSRAVRALATRPDCVLVDGCNRPPELLRAGECWTRGSKKLSGETPTVKQKGQKERKGQLQSNITRGQKGAWIPKRVEAVIGGDSRVPSISAASVLAKVYRDQLMEKLHAQFPMYGFGTHKGYGTQGHLAAIKEHGVCPDHRRSFAPVREALELQ